MTESDTTAGRSYGCTFGDGNPFDFILVDIRSGTTEILCLPCLVRLAGDMVAAITEADNPNLRAALDYAASDPQDQVPGPTGKRRGKNPPVTVTDPDLFDAFDASIPDTVDDTGGI